MKAYVIDKDYNIIGEHEMKHDDNKYKPSLIYTSLLIGISRVRKYGIKKYGSDTDWKTTESSRHLDAAIRHIRAVIDGEAFDKQSHLLHLSHAASNIMFEIERVRINALLPPNEPPKFTMDGISVDPDTLDLLEEGDR